MNHPNSMWSHIRLMLLLRRINNAYTVSGLVISIDLTI